MRFWWLIPNPATTERKAMMTQNGSAAAFVMRTGQFQPISPRDARQDLTEAHVNALTTDISNQVFDLLPAPHSPITLAVSQTVTAVPPTPIQVPPTAAPTTLSGQHAWHQHHRRQHPAIEDIRKLHPRAQLHGAQAVQLGEWNGRPIAKFEINASPTQASAASAAHAMRRAAQRLKQAGLAELPPELIAGPLAALLRGGAIELHFQNGVVIRTAP